MEEVAEEPVIFLGGAYLPDDVNVTPFRCLIVYGVNKSFNHVAPGLELFLTGLVLRRPDIRKIHVFYERDREPDYSPSKVLRIAAISMKYTGVTLQEYSGRTFQQAKMFAIERQQAATAAVNVKDAIVVDKS